MEHNDIASRFKLIDQRGDVALLKNLGEDAEPFIVANGMAGNKWSSGKSYHATLASARVDFDRKTKF